MQIFMGQPLGARDLARVREFLARNGLDYDAGVERTVCIEADGQLIATGSRQANVLKCIAVDASHRGEDLSAKVVGALVEDAFEAGQNHLFIYTKPENRDLFMPLGFFKVAETADVLLMENIRGGVQKFVSSLENPATDGIVGAIVANCNPFTKGHLHLIEFAARASSVLHLFIVSEDRSYFSAADRIAMARLGARHLENVLVHATSDYMISSATFPEYFIKDKIRAKGIGYALDLTIFARCFCAPMGITRRFVGEEPNDPVTEGYNRAMLDILPPLGVEVDVIPRRELGGSAISASRVRALIQAGRFCESRPLLPESTYSYIERNALDVPR